MFSSPSSPLVFLLLLTSLLKLNIFFSLGREIFFSIFQLLYCCSITLNLTFKIGPQRKTVGRGLGSLQKKKKGKM